MPFNISSPKKLFGGSSSASSTATSSGEKNRHRSKFTTNKEIVSNQPANQYQTPISTPQPASAPHLTVSTENPFGPGDTSSPPPPPAYQRVTSPLAQPPTTIQDHDGFASPTATPPAVPEKDFGVQSPLGFLAGSEKSGSTSSTDSKSTSLLPKINTSSTLNPTSESSSFYEINGGLSPTFATSSKLRKNQQNIAAASVSDTSLHKRTLSDRVKATPSSFVRQSRIFSNDDDESTFSASSVSGKDLLLQNKLQTDSLPPEFRPIVSLINAQKLRTYCVGSLQVPGVMEGEKVWFEVEAKLTGSELAIWRPLTDEFVFDEGNEFKPKYINVIDSHVEVLSNLDIKIYHDYREDAAVMVRFHDKESFNKWMSAIILSKYEYEKLNEAFTAVILSSKGSKLLDIHVLLGNKKRFPQYEWCNIRVPEVSTKWIKVYMVVLPSDKGHIGRIEFYPSDKKVLKKHLIAYISDLAAIFNVYPEQSNMIDVNSIMRAAGEIHISKNYEHLFPHSMESELQHQAQLNPRKLIAKNHGISRSGSNDSLSSLSRDTPGTPVNRSRSGSLNSTSSFFNQPSSPPSGSGLARSGSLNGSPINPNHDQKGHKRISSTFFKRHADDFVLTNSMYIMPISHPGVNAVETMVRNYIPIIDAFKLYGRPKRLASDKTDTNSMLFGLPSLPHYQYLSNKDAEKAFAANYRDDLSWFEWPEIMSKEIKSLQSSCSKTYRGFGDIGKLYENLDLDFNEISSPVLNFTNFEDDVPSLSDTIEFGGRIGSPPRVASPLSLVDDGTSFGGTRNLMV
ncbi:hypothetical protein Cantr_03177 [Candida viswanathii]|uniref:Skg3/CAF120-like PH-like domain-containing protein n=1 Tax=Candida viswanathii TaxID=5486 RepID=A0A367YQH2_9ASCO|nr:hypothetical protein Cantr_03177 [Candida viswanathii]